MSRRSSDSGSVTISGFGLGTIIACILSWSTWHSVIWCIINGLFGWFYVIYWLFVHWDGTQ